MDQTLLVLTSILLGAALFLVLLPILPVVFALRYERGT